MPKQNVDISKSRFVMIYILDGFVYCCFLLASKCCNHPASNSSFFFAYTCYYWFSCPLEATVYITIFGLIPWFKLGKWHSWLSDWTAGWSTAWIMENVPCPCSSCNSTLVLQWFFYEMCACKMKCVPVHFIFIRIDLELETDFQLEQLLQRA